MMIKIALPFFALFGSALLSTSDAFLSPSALSTKRSFVVKEQLFVLAEGATDNNVASSMDEPKNTIFVGNLPLDTNADAVKELFLQHGEVQNVNMPIRRETNQPRGFAFVDMNTKDDMEAAIAALNGQNFSGRTLRVSVSLPKDEVVKGERPQRTPRAAQELPEGYKKVYVGNIPFDCDKQDILDFITPHGEVTEVFIPSDPRTGRGRGFAFVTMKEEDATKAIEATNGSEFAGRRVTVSLPLPPGERAPPRTFEPRGDRNNRERNNDNRTKMYIGNLSFYTTADTLIDIFQEFGTVHDCYMPEDPSTGSTRGFGFVTMDKDAAAVAIEKIDGCEVDGRTIRVNEAQRKKFTPRNDFD